MLKAYKYRLLPTKQQAIYLDRNFGAVRFIWNQLVANFNAYHTDAHVTKLSEKQIKEEYKFLDEAIAYALQQKRMDFMETCKQYFNKRRKTRIGRMKFKKRGVCNDSFRIPGQAIGYSKGVDFDTQRVRIPKMGNVKVVIDQRFHGELRSITISKTKTNEYYVSCLVETHIEHKPATGREVGLDLGLTDLLITSDGVKFQNPKFFRETQAKLAKAQRHLSRKKKGSNRRNKQRLKVAKIYQKITRQRNWYYHNITTHLVNMYDSIFVEDLNVKGMVKNRKLSKAIHDAAWSSLITMLSYKSKWYGRDFHKIDRFYPSSKTCHVCKSATNLFLSGRIWTCANCNTVHDRDVNAAHNILLQGRLELYGVVEDTSVESPDYSRREDVRPLDLSKADFVEAISDFIDLYKVA